MTEIIKYIADDGKVFEDQYECIEYEMLEDNPYINDIKFFDENGNKLTFKSTDDFDSFFGNVYKIVIDNDDQVKSLKKLGDFYGWIDALESINEVGTWVYYDGFETFIRIDDILNEYIGQIKWERDMAMEQLKNIDIPFMQKCEDITKSIATNTNGIQVLYDLINKGNVKIIQIN